MRRSTAAKRKPSTITLRDLMSEALTGILQRPARAILTALGTVLGVGAFVAILGLTATASSQIDTRFSVLTATEVTVEDVAKKVNQFADPAFPIDADDRVARLPGVREAGVFWTVRTDTRTAVRPSLAATSDSGETTSVMAVSAGAFRAAVPHLQQGRIYDDFHERRAEQVAVIGSAVAAQLGITTLTAQPAVFIGEQPFTVIGIVDDVERKAELLLSVAIPRATAEAIWGPPRDEPASMLISTKIGAATQVAQQVPIALRPDHPEYLKATPPPDPRSLRSGVNNDLSQLFLLLATICLIIGAVGIANTTLVAVLERTGEIGLRRALGARAHHIVAQFLAESAALGTLGGIVGTSLGTMTVVAVAVARDWTPVIHPLTVAAAPGIGLLTGIVAGLYPALRASQIQPVEALRR
ncbi:ABC transporter permease [Streptomyces sp. NBC_01077]|uniref:ABC transporter permease n=1 Tax=Streptomyces sp. NBC_01077 TaxID=2903746 RepID=UPI003865F761|nr:ABC transporter permease [Streptomyces sp. NBC_01077]WSV43692.1 ABC transporter permease [Streptomyces sp. NBC_01077]